jgi:hypothetical protein
MIRAWVVSSTATDLDAVASSLYRDFSLIYKSAVTIFINGAYIENLNY